MKWGGDDHQRTEWNGSASPKMYEGSREEIFSKKRPFAWIYLAGFGVLVPTNRGAKGFGVFLNERTNIHIRLSCRGK